MGRTHPSEMDEKRASGAVRADVPSQSGEPARLAVEDSAEDAARGRCRSSPGQTTMTLESVRARPGS